MDALEKKLYCTVLVTKSQLGIRDDTVVLFGDPRMGADGIMAQMCCRPAKIKGYFWTAFHSNSIIKGQFEIGVQWCSLHVGYKLVSDFFATSGTGW